jgi:hypothetical protein
MTTPNYQVPEWEAPRPSTSKSSTGFSQHNSAPPLPGVLPSTAAKEEAPPPAYDGVVAHPPRPTLRQRFDLLFPPHRRYIRGRLTRRLFLFVLFASFFILLSLILGLAIGLSRRTSHPSSLPLPGNTQIFTGDLTYYAPALGACGITSSPSDLICAVSHLVFDAASTGSNPNANPLCGRRIRVQRYDDRPGVQANRSVDVRVVDRCVGCAATDLDLSPAAFDELAGEEMGRVVGSWVWL